MDFRFANWTHRHRSLSGSAGIIGVVLDQISCKANWQANQKLQRLADTLLAQPTTQLNRISQMQERRDQDPGQAQTRDCNNTRSRATPSEGVQFKFIAVLGSGVEINRCKIFYWKKMEGWNREKSVCIFESVGGNDKGPDGHRKDTLPIVEQVKALGWHCEVVKFENDRAEEIYNEVKSKFSGYVTRVNPGSLPDNEKTLFDVLRRLSNDGLVGMPHPDSMINFGAKSALVKLNKTGLVPEDTDVYYQVEPFKARFPVSLSRGERVLKQNRGSTGEGIWRVVYEDERPYSAGDSLPLDTKIKCTEAVDNHVEHRQLGEFMEFCEKYIVGDQGMLVDMQFLPRIKEGEIRILLVGAHPIFVVHKKPADSADAFSATLFSGAKYRYDKPEEWQHLVDFFLQRLPMIKDTLKEHEPPLIWTADFILDWDEEKKDKYVLGEINCSCVGFTSHLDMGIQEVIAKEIIRQATAHRKE